MEKALMHSGEVNKDAAAIIAQMKAGKLSVFEVPEAYTNDPDVLAYEREHHLRVSENRGYDVITNRFFVEEKLIAFEGKTDSWERPHTAFFDTFDAYWNYLQGDVYENACYRFAQFPKETVDKYNLNVERMMERSAFIKEPMQILQVTATTEELEEYKNVSAKRKSLPKIVAEVNACRSAEEIKNVERKYRRNAFMRMEKDPCFLLSNYVQANSDKDYCLDAVFAYLAQCENPSEAKNFVRGLCLIMNPDEVLAKYRYSNHVNKQTEYKNRRELKLFIEEHRTGHITIKTRAGFDLKTHCFFEKTSGYPDEDYALPTAVVYRYFDTFEEFIAYRKGDLTYCNLSNAMLLNADFSGFITDQTTYLPLHMRNDLTYHIKKQYADGEFAVIQWWTAGENTVVKKQVRPFKYFFDFVAFLRGDLTKADLLFCDGLENLAEWDGIDFIDAVLTSRLCEKFHISYRPYTILPDLTPTFPVPEQNEIVTEMVLATNRDLLDENDDDDDETTSENDYSKSIYYISDLHLMHRIQNAECRSTADVAYTVGNIARTINNEAHGLVLIPGDVASDFHIFQNFIKRLDNNKTFVFTLGNHELWGHPGKSLNEIVEKYRNVLTEQKMFLLQNALLYTVPEGMFGEDKLKVIEYDELQMLSDDEIRERLRYTRYAILGGIGFSGYNDEFNATNGIYQQVLDRQEEIAESAKFEALYKRLVPILSKKHTVILTHTPKTDWSSEPTLHEHFVYVCGHNHRNAFHDDGTLRYYADNQIGYHHETPHLKSFRINDDYDCFDDYEDGIYTITPEQYRSFYRGKNIGMDYNQKPAAIYMLKRTGYYCFFQSAGSRSLCILHGGQATKVTLQPIEYYYDHMPEMIAAIQKPMSKYSEVQEQIAGLVRRIGGDGSIHGSIIDIDFNNHIYLNPNDFSVTGYWASDMVHKLVYPSVAALLQKNCPELYAEYQRQIAGTEENPPFDLAISEETAAVPQLYLDTDIYHSSRVISKMQRLQSNILSVWHEQLVNPKTQIVLT